MVGVNSMSRLKGKIKIIKKSETRKDGRPVYTDITIRECIAEILDLYGQELYNAMSMDLQNTAVFKVRYCNIMEQLRTNKNDYKVIYNGITYNLYQADFGKYPKQYVLLKCNIKA